LILAAETGRYATPLERRARRKAMAAAIGVPTAQTKTPKPSTNDPTVQPAGKGGPLQRADHSAPAQLTPHIG
jgi:hypothetical protein